MKEKLDRCRAGRDWSEFLEDLLERALRAERERAFRELRGRVIKHLDSVEESSREFRRRFSLR